jgi:uncharacterized protein (DUF433 family)
MTTATELSFISHTPGVSGGDACVRNTRIPVWLLAEMRLAGMCDAEILAGYPETLNQADLEVAWQYHTDHPAEITQALRLNREDN